MVTDKYYNQAFASGHLIYYRSSKDASAIRNYYHIIIINSITHDLSLEFPTWWYQVAVHHTYQASIMNTHYLLCTQSYTYLVSLIYVFTLQFCNWQTFAVEMAYGAPLTALRQWHSIDSASSTALRWQRFVNSAPLTALRQRRSVDSASSTALRWQRFVNSAPLTALWQQHSVDSASSTALRWQRFVNGALTTTFHWRHSIDGASMAVATEQ